MEAVQFLPLLVRNVQFGRVGCFQRWRGVRRCRRRREGQLDLLVAARRGGGGGVCERGGVRQEGRGTVHVSDEVDKLPLVVDALLLRDGLLLFPLPMEVGEDEGTGSAATDRHQSQDAHEDNVEADRPVFRV